MAPSLTWDVFLAPPKAFVNDGPPPGVRQERTWPPTSATLIAGERDAVLVDALLTVDEARALADWIAAAGRNLTTIYLTHGHGDHTFGLTVILDRFPDARAVATPGVVEQMRQQTSPDRVAAVWDLLFPGQLPDPLVIPDPLKGGEGFELEGNELVPVELGHTDTDSSTCLHAPAVGLVVAGDAAYNGVHPYLGESDALGRRDWIAGLDTIGSLHPSAVIAGHKRAGADDHARIVEETREYIREFDQVARNTTTALELYEQVFALYPDRVNPGALWDSARALHPDGS